VSKEFYSNLIAPRLESIEYYTTRLTENGPALLIDPSCRKLIKALASGWRYEKNRKSGVDKDVPEKNEHSHVGDGFGYSCQYHAENGSRQARRKSSNFVVPTFQNTYNVR
jgi:hypothetical protein